MKNENYLKALEDAKAEIAQLLDVREGLDRRLTRLKSTVALLSGLLEEAPKLEVQELPDELGDLGITEAIRAILRDAQVALTPAQIKQKLIDANFDLNRYANSSAVIHNTLRRLEAQKEVIPVKIESGGAYAFRFPIPDFAEQLAKYAASYPFGTLEGLTEQSKGATMPFASGKK